jgi:hypothetical protein
MPMQADASCTCCTLTPHIRQPTTTG